jgi:hypothetical protein
VVPSRSKRLTDPGTSFKPQTEATLVPDNHEQANGAGGPTENDQFAENNRDNSSAKDPATS